jgi:hypothetical protein
MDISFPIPFVPDFHNLQLETGIGFALGLLFAVLFNAEGQAFMATCLGDRREEPQIGSISMPSFIWIFSAPCHFC